MTEDILQYIKNEKDLARYQITFLEKKPFSPAIKRMLLTEKEFLQLPLEKMHFEDLADVASAISIFRDSRSLFYETYQIEMPEIEEHRNKKQVKQKIVFLQMTQSRILEQIQEVNLVQCPSLYEELARHNAEKNKTDLVSEKNKLDLLNLNQLNSIEPIALSKKRARLQICLYALYLLIEKFLEMPGDYELFIKTLGEQLFQYYNIAISLLTNIVKNTMGENSYITKSKQLKNLGKMAKFEMQVKNLQIINQICVTNLFSDQLLENRSLGIIFPIPRKGNEKMSLYYKDIMFNGFSISHLFYDHISNVKNHQGEYFKALLMLSPKKLYEIVKAESSVKSFFEYLFNEKFNSSQQFSYLLKSSSGKVNIENSTILVAPTRSEEEGLVDIKQNLETIITEIQNEYFSKFAY